MHRQPSLFGVEASDPTPGDLAGLLAGPGELGRMGGTARVSVVVDAAWRVHALIAELVRRGLTAGWEPAGEGRFVVRSAYSTRLFTFAAGWSGERNRKRVPDDLHLSGHALRVWVAASGVPVPGGFDLRLGARDRSCWPAVGSALRAAGLPADLVAPGDGGPAYRVGAGPALVRLAELVGPPPPAVPPDTWPRPHPDPEPDPGPNPEPDPRPDRPRNRASR